MRLPLLLLLPLQQLLVQLLLQLLLRRPRVGEQDDGLLESKSRAVDPEDHGPP